MPLFLLSSGLRLYSAWNSLAMGGVMALYVLSVFLVPRARWRTIGLCRIRSRRALAWTLSMVLLTYLTVALVEWRVFGNSEDNWVTGLVRLFRSLPVGWGISLVLMVIMLGAVVPLAEEVFFRGVLQTPLTEHYGVVWGIVLTSVLWALVHLGNYGLVPLNGRVIAGVLPSVFLMGLGLGATRMVTRSVLGSAVAQGLANICLGVWALWLTR